MFLKSRDAVDCSHRLQQNLSQRDEELQQLQTQLQERSSALHNKQLRIEELEQNQKVSPLEQQTRHSVGKGRLRGECPAD